MGAWIVTCRGTSAPGGYEKVLGAYLTRKEALVVKDACLRVHPGATVTVGLLTEVQVYRPGDAMGGAELGEVR